MDHVGAYDARTHFSALLKRVEAGERITITRHGVPVARLVPASQEESVPASEAVTGLLSFRAGRTLGTDLSIRDLVETGRR